MKKTYISPETEVLNVNNTPILAGSESVNVDSGNTEGEGGWGPAQGKEGFLDISGTETPKLDFGE